jgi:hypothetical protein
MQVWIKLLLDPSPTKSLLPELCSPTVLNQLNGNTTTMSSMPRLISTSNTVLLHFASSAPLFSPSSGELLLDSSLKELTWMITPPSKLASSNTEKLTSKSPLLVDPNKPPPLKLWTP